MPETVTLHGANEGEACLSLAACVDVCAYPKDMARRNDLMDTFAAWLEARGYLVFQRPHPMIQIRRRWRRMSRATMRHVIDNAAYRLRRRRFAAVELAVFRNFRPEGVSIDTVHKNFHRGRSRPTDAAANNIRTFVWAESRPILHVAFALRAEFLNADISAWEWPLLCLSEPQERLNRVVRCAETTRRALQAPWIGGRSDPGIPDEDQVRMVISD